MPSSDPLRLVFVVGTSDCPEGRLEDTVMKAVRGGATMIQLREKKTAGKDFFEKACRLKKILASFSTPLIINDRIDIALASEADGVHIGQLDLPIAQTRRLMGDKKIIGLSIENMAQAKEVASRKAVSDEISYFGAGPVFTTQSKPDASPCLGIKAFGQIARLLPKPTIAIGGITKEAIAPLFEENAHGVAVISAIAQASCPEDATRQIYDAIYSRLKA